MKTNKILNCAIYIVATVLAALVLLAIPAKREVVEYSFKLCDDFMEVTYQPKNIFGVDLGEEYTVYEPNR